MTSESGEWLWLPDVKREGIPNFRAETRKAREPNERLWRGTKSNWVEDERVNFEVVWKCIRSAIYGGRPVCSALIVSECTVCSPAITEFRKITAASVRFCRRERSSVGDRRMSRWMTGRANTIHRIYNKVNNFIANDLDKLLSFPVLSKRF